MATKHKTQEGGVSRSLHIRVAPAQLDRFREVVAADHRTVSQDLRRYIDQRVAEASAAADSIRSAA